MQAPRVTFQLFFDEGEGVSGYPRKANEVMGTVTFVKLGGSLITEKEEPYTERPAVIERLSREVAESWDAHGGQIVLGHGSGSFGHVAADRTGLLDPDADESRANALSHTQHAATTLHRHVVAALREADVPVFSFAPSSAFVASEGDPVYAHVEPLCRALELGIVPITLGDVVFDREQGGTICSTESVFRMLIRELEAHGVSTRRVIWLGDTKGVYDADGETIETLTPDRAAQLLDEIGAAAGTDVTGGMRHRLHTALALARHGTSSLIASGLAPGCLRNALRGTAVTGTRVRPE